MDDIKLNPEHKHLIITDNGSELRVAGYNITDRGEMLKTLAAALRQDGDDGILMKEILKLMLKEALEMTGENSEQYKEMKRKMDKLFLKETLLQTIKTNNEA